MSVIGRMNGMRAAQAAMVAAQAAQTKADNANVAANTADNKAATAAATAAAANAAAISATKLTQAIKVRLTQATLIGLPVYKDVLFTWPDEFSTDTYKVTCTVVLLTAPTGIKLISDLTVHSLTKTGGKVNYQQLLTVGANAVEIHLIGRHP